MNTWRISWDVLGNEVVLTFDCLQKAVDYIEYACLVKFTMERLS